MKHLCKFSGVLFACLLAICAILVPGCNRNGESLLKNYGRIRGVVRNTSGHLIEGVTINTEDNTAISDNNGYFNMMDLIETDRLVVNFTKQGYCVTSKIAKIQSEIDTYLEVVMKAYENSATISSDIGGTVTTLDGGSVTIDANALEDSYGNPYTGQATIAITTFNPTNENELGCFPGDFEGITTSGDIRPFECYGFVDVTIMDNNGSMLQLASGQTAIIESPISPSLVSSAPNSIPLWYYDTTDGKWYEDGFAIKNGTIYQGSVTHFSPWNWDDEIDDFCQVTGRVVDENGNPIRGAIVLITGTAGGVWMAGDKSVGADGTFSIRVPANRQATIQVTANGINGNPQFISTCFNDETNNLGDISLQGFVHGDTEVAFWNFEEGVAGNQASGTDKVLDVSGNGHHGTPYNGPIYRNSPVAPGSSLALEFDGSDDRVFVSDHSGFYLTQNITISAHIRVDSKPSGTGTDIWHMILFRGDTRGGLDPYWLGITPEGHVRFNINNESNQTAAVVSNSPVTLGKFIHVVASLNGTTGEMKLTIDNSLEGSLYTSVRPFGELSTAHEPGLGIGCEQTGAYMHFDGIIDDVRISK